MDNGQCVRFSIAFRSTSSPLRSQFATKSAKWAHLRFQVFCHARYSRRFRIFLQRWHCVAFSGVFKWYLVYRFFVFMFFDFWRWWFIEWSWSDNGFKGRCTSLASFMGVTSKFRANGDSCNSAQSENDTNNWFRQMNYVIYSREALFRYQILRWQFAYTSNGSRFTLHVFLALFVHFLSNLFNLFLTFTMCVRVCECVPAIGHVNIIDR